MKTPQIPPLPGMTPLGIKSDPETELRALWDAKGVPRDRQDAMIAEIEAKARPEYLARIFQPLSTDQSEIAKRKAAAPLRPAKEQKPCDIGLFSDEADQTDLIEMLMD